MPQYDPYNYYNQNSGSYSQIPQSTSYQPTGGAFAPAPWANANNYGPGYAGQGGSGYRNPNFMGGSGSGATAGGLIGGGLAAAQGASLGAATGIGLGGGALLGLGALGGPLGLGLAGLGAAFGLIQGKKKRSSPDFYAPSYQGTMFTPAEGLPQYYQPSQEGMAANQTQQDYYSQQAPAKQAPQQQSMSNAMNGGSYDYNYTNGSQSSPDYVNQSLYGRYGDSGKNPLSGLTDTFKVGGQY
jgi:hypothetical protein